MGHFWEVVEEVWPEQKEALERTEWSGREVGRRYSEKDSPESLGMTKRWVPQVQENTILQGLEGKLGLQTMKVDSKLELLGLY